MAKTDIEKYKQEIASLKVTVVQEQQAAELAKMQLADLDKQHGKLKDEFEKYKKASKKKITEEINKKVKEEVQKELDKQAAGYEEKIAKLKSK